MGWLRDMWNRASFFWKTYLLAVGFVGGIVLGGELLEDYWEGVLLLDLPYWQREACMWLLATILPTALGCFWLTRLFTGPLRRLTANIERLSVGDLSIRMDAEDTARKDELGTLVRAFNFMAERLEQIRQAERRLLVDISHELRSPLTRMGVALALLRREAERRQPQDDRQQNEHLERLELEMERMNTLIGQLLAHAREEAGEHPRERVDVQQLVASVMDDALFECGALEDTAIAPVKWRLVPAHIWGDAELLHRAVDNIVRNALRYSPAGSTVEVTLEAGHRGGREGWVLTVADQGPGVPETALADLFRPFYRVDEARSRESGGVGLGLAIAEQAVRLHGGQISAANREHGAGLVVSLFLPGAE